MDKPGFYQIRVEGHLSDRWTDWFDGLAIRNDPNGETTSGGLALYGGAPVLLTAHRRRGP